MKKKMMLLLIALVGMSIFTPNVNAKPNAKITRVKPMGFTGITYHPEGDKSTLSKRFNVYDEYIKFDGDNKEYKAYCVDPSLSARSGDEITCTPLDFPGLENLFNIPDLTTAALAFRFYSIFAGVGASVTDENGTVIRDTLTYQKAALIKYLQARDEGSGYEQYLKGNNGVIEAAWSIANRFAPRTANGLPAITSDSEGGLDYTIYSSTDTSVTYIVTAPAPIKEGDIEFTCDGCASIETSNWTGDSVTVKVNQLSSTGEGCKFTINAVFKKSGVYGCYGRPGKQFLVVYVDNPTNIKSSFEGENPKCNPDKCCNEGPDIGSPKGIVANCCEESTHSYISEPDLDDLFCYHNGLKVDKYWERCETNQYKNKDLGEPINDYCDLYCSERVSIDVPPPITAKSGRYFTLTENQAAPGYKSPYIQGFKRCRVRVKYDKWEKKYIRNIKEEVKLYNKYQLAAANYHFYVEGGKGGFIDSEEKTGEITVYKYCNVNSTCTRYDPCTSGKDCKNGYKPVPYACVVATDYKTATYNYTYNKYEFKTMLKYGKATSVVNGHDYIHVIDNGTGIATHDKYTVYNRSEEVNKAKALANTLSCDAGEIDNGIGIQEIPDGQYKNEDFDGMEDSLEGQMNAAANAYYAQIDVVKNLEKQLTECDDFFKNKKKEEMYRFNPSITFKYNQIYRNEEGKSELSDIRIPFKSTPGCVINEPEYGSLTYEGGMDTANPRYSGEYLTGEFMGKDFKPVTLQYDNTGGLLSTFVDNGNEIYEAKKMFTHDARYHAECKWEEEENHVNTLVPNGQVSTEEIANFTRHKREYKVFLATYDGTYETDWSVTGLGPKFDSFIKQNGGSTCAGDNVTSENNFTCTLHVEYEIVLTGKCNGVAKSVEVCDPVDNVEQLFQFKVVNPSNIFPTGTTTDSGEAIAKNWTDTDEGRATKEEIEQRGKRDTTYSPERESYKFHLTPETMRHIKNYNLSRNSNNIGGYSDFNMTCECPDDYQTNTANDPNAKGCVKCRSTLLSDLANNRITYEGQTYTVRAWASQKTINQVRDEAHWRLNR